MPAITTTDLTNAALDIQTIAEVAMVNYTADTTTNRNGDVVNTLQGALALLGYQPAVTYAGSIVFGANDHTKTIDRSGVIYAPLPSELPFTTTGTWGTDSAKFFTIQTTGDTIRVDDLVTLTGRPANSTGLGNFTGAIISTDPTIKVALQDLETSADAMIDLSGRPDGSVDLGTFTGSTISNNVTIKVALQELETALEVADSGTYTPVDTIGTNVTSATGYQTFYNREGDIISFAGVVLVFPTASGPFDLTLTVPVASNFTSSVDASGSCSCSNASRAVLYAETTANEFKIEGNATSSSNFNVYYSGMYIVK